MNVIERFRKCRKEKFLSGGTLSRERKIDILKHTYSKAALFSDRELIRPILDTELDKLSDESIDGYYDFFTNHPGYIYSPLGEGLTVVGYRPLKLLTNYPMAHIWYNSSKDRRYKWTGHSAITGGALGTKTFSDYDYNLITNNCSDETRRMLEAVFDKEADIIGFTTPGDVRDFAIDNGGILKDTLGRLIIIPMNLDKYGRLNTYIGLRILRRRNHYRREHGK